MNDPEVANWDAEARYRYHERIGSLIGAANPIPEEADELARMEVRGYLLAERKRKKHGLSGING